MDNFSLVKEAVSAVDVWNLYSGAPVRRGFANCIYHKDAKPSLRLYEGSRGFYCFSCQAGGDAIKLAGDLLNLSPVDALKRLNADYRIGLDLDKPPNSEEIKRAQKRRKAIESFESWLDGAFLTLTTYHQVLWQTKQKSPKLLEQFSPLQVEALHELEKTSYYLDCLNDDPMSTYKSSRGYIARIAQRLEGMKKSEDIYGRGTELLHSNRKGRPCC